MRGILSTTPALPPGRLSRVAPPSPGSGTRASARTPSSLCQGRHGTAHLRVASITRIRWRVITPMRAAITMASSRSTVHIRGSMCQKPRIPIPTGSTTGALSRDRFLTPPSWRKDGWERLAASSRSRTTLARQLRLSWVSTIWEIYAVVMGQPPPWHKRHLLPFCSSDNNSLMTTITRVRGLW